MPRPPRQGARGGASPTTAQVTAPGTPCLASWWSARAGELPGPLPGLGGPVCPARRLPPSCCGVEPLAPRNACRLVPGPTRPASEPAATTAASSSSAAPGTGGATPTTAYSCSGMPGPTTWWSARTRPYPARFRACSCSVSHILRWVPRGELLPSRPCHSSGQASTRSRTSPPLGPAAGASSASPFPPPFPPAGAVAADHNPAATGLSILGATAVERPSRRLTTRRGFAGPRAPPSRC